MTIVYMGMLIAAMVGVVIAAIMLLGAPHEGDRPAAWFWGAYFAASSLVAALAFWELLEGSA